MSKSQAFTTNYNVGGDIDRVKNLKQVDNITQVEVLDKVNGIDNVSNLDTVGNIDILQKVNVVSNMQNLENVNKIESVDKIKEIGKIRGFPQKTQPYNIMKMFDIPASYKDPITNGDYIYEIELPSEEIEIMAITLTCSGYGEDDHYDLYFNDEKWFEDWYCSEVREGLFLGTSTYVYAAPPDSKIKLVFKNDSGSAKKLWLGIRMLK